MSLDSIVPDADDLRKITAHLPAAVRGNWARLSPAGDALKESFSLHLQEHFGFAPTGGVISCEHCPRCETANKTWWINWRSCCFFCTSCRWSGGLAALLSLLSHQPPHRETDGMVEFLDRGGLVPRLGVQDMHRDAAVKAGVRAMIEAGAGNPWALAGRVDEHLERVLEGYADCGGPVLWKGYEHRTHGPSYQPARYGPCNQPGHEKCAWAHAQRDLLKHESKFRKHYGGRVVVVLDFAAPGRGPRTVRECVENLKKRGAHRPLLDRTFGVLVAEADGFHYLVLVRRDDLHLKELAVSSWQGLVPGGTVSERCVPPWASALDVAAELRCLSEQGIPVLVGSGQLNPETGRQWLTEMLGDAEARLPSVRRVVFGLGFQATLAGQSDDIQADSSQFGSKNSIPPLDPNCAPDVAGASPPAGALPEHGFEVVDRQGAETKTHPSENGQTGNGLDVTEQPPGDELRHHHKEDSRVTVGRGEPNSPAAKHNDWAPCQVCGQPSCGQRPAENLRPLGRYQMQAAIRRGEWVPVQRRGQIVACIRPQDVHVARKDE